jgi:HlyD family secretion protein
MNPAEKPITPAGRKPGNNGSHRPRRWLPWLGVLVLLGVITFGLWPQPVVVETASATVGPLRAVISEEGKTRIKQRFVISAPITGMLRRIPFKAGAEVVAGETVLAVIDPQPPAPLDARNRAMGDARRGSAVADLEKARANQAFADSELKRFEKLYASGTATAEEIESARLKSVAAAKNTASAEGTLRQVDAGLKDFSVAPATDAGPASASISSPVEIKSPITGRILRVPEESSRIVNLGTTLMEIGDPSDLEIVIEVLSRDGAAVTPGTKVEFEQWGGGEPLQGTVRLVEPAAFTKVSALGVEEQRVNVVADLLTPADQRRNLGDQFRVEARIIIWEDPQALKVPTASLFRHGDQWSVFIIANGRAELRAVKVGRSSGNETQILEGLKPSDPVILNPGNRVTAGQRVKPVKV